MRHPIQVRQGTALRPDPLRRPPLRSKLINLSYPGNLLRPTQLTQPLSIHRPIPGLSLHPNLTYPNKRKQGLFWDRAPPAPKEDMLTRNRPAILAIALLGVWLGVVIFTATRHEFGRDEVRALSLARSALSPLDLYRLTQYDGHPLLWYLLLYIGRWVVDTALVLPVTSILIAFAAVAVFIFAAPFSLWMRGLFIFTALPFYEYSIMARNYGISMLLLFLAAMLYRQRREHPLLLAFSLALLANTNVHSAILASLIGALWGWDVVREQRARSPRATSRHYLAFAIVFGGLILCAISSMPRENTILTSPLDSLTAPDIANAVLEATLRPDQTFSRLSFVSNRLPTFVADPLLLYLLLVLAVLGLVHRLDLLLVALSAQIALGVLFRVVYPGGYRHQGLFLVFLVFLYWLLIDSSTVKTISGTKRLLYKAGLYAVVALMVGNVAKAAQAIRFDSGQEMSSSRALGAFLNGSAVYRDAIMVPEPDFSLESLPYYADNLIFFPREQRFGTTVSWTTEARERLSLGELSSVAHRIRARHRRPVLIVLGHRDLDSRKDGEKAYSYNKIFSWSSAEVADFRRSTTLVAEFKSARGGENYRIYAIR